MAQEHDDWKELRTQAVKLLHNPAQLPNQRMLHRYSQRLHLWHEPATGIYTSWQILRSNFIDDTRYLLHETMWNWPVDFKRVLQYPPQIKPEGHTTPTIFTRHIHVAPDEINRHLSTLASISFPALLPDESIVDGDEFGIEIMHQVSTRITWWNEGPASWREVVTWFHEIKAYLASELETVTCD